MIVKTIQQFLLQVAWGELDYLLVDLPPGTGDAQLTLCQTTPLDGDVIVTTPQEASLGVVRKGIAMFEKVIGPGVQTMRLVIDGGEFNVNTITTVKDAGDPSPPAGVSAGRNC